ncbi:MAG: hypothetical protein OXT06_09210 [Rhodospirillaceae bacterium]|nr:hypothetical protein [Rhodospirillaceae bacterium]
MTHTPPCRECGAPCEAQRGDATFCSTKCKNAWQNRRRKRGAELYDLFMTMRHERDLTKRLADEQDFHVWSTACALASKWKDEDERERAGRKSWQSILPLIQKGTWAYLKAKLVGIDGTGRYGGK